jgi:hypothetical protein
VRAVHADILLLKWAIGLCIRNKLYVVASRKPE